MSFNKSLYRCLKLQTYGIADSQIVPIRYNDRLDIMRWRNQQMYHLRQAKPLTELDQDKYFSEVVSTLFDQKEPPQILFSFLDNGNCIGYGGLVHINWIDKHAEISFLLDTSITGDLFAKHWSSFLSLIEIVAFEELDLHKIYTYAFDVRPYLYNVLEMNGYFKDAQLKEHCFIEGKYLDVLLHSKINSFFRLRKAANNDVQLTYEWASNEEIRRFSFSNNKITKDSHRQWFCSKLSSRNCYYYIFIIGKSPAGSIRFDQESTDKVVVSYLLDTKYHGKGYGAKILSTGIDALRREAPLVQTIIAEVQPNNFASMKIFENLEFNVVEQSDSKFVFKKRIN